VLIFIVNVCFVVFPYNFWLCNFFDDLDFGDKRYQYLVALAIILNTIITFVAEKVIAVPFTAWYDRRLEKKKEVEFEAVMLKKESSYRSTHSSGSARSSGTS